MYSISLCLVIWIVYTLQVFHFKVFAGLFLRRREFAICKLDAVVDAHPDKQLLEICQWKLSTCMKWHRDSFNDL